MATFMAARLDERKRRRRNAVTPVRIGCILAAIAVTAPPSARCGLPVVQLPSPEACVSEDGSAGLCADGFALNGASGSATSPDGRHVYVSAGVSGAVAVFDRDPTTGALTQKAGAAACVSEDGTAGSCVDGVALTGASSVVVSPDGANVYVVSTTSSAVAVFNRNPVSGNLTQKAGTDGCVSSTGTGGFCVDGVELASIIGVVISADGRNLYVAASASGSVATFDRDPSTGVLTQKAGLPGCTTDTGSLGACTLGRGIAGVIGIAIAPDGKNVYSAAITSNAIAVFARNLATGELTQLANAAGCVSDDGANGCADGTALDGVISVAVSPDGRNVYAASQDSDAVLIFDRDQGTGALTQKAADFGCISETGTGGSCVDGVGLDEAATVIVSPDGRGVFVTSETSDGIAVFDRDPETGALGQQSGLAACITLTGSGGDCATGKALDFPLEVSISPDGRSLYVAANTSDAIAVFARYPLVFDIDGDGDIDALTDGLLLLRNSFGFSGATLIAGAVDLVDCTRCTAPAIQAWIEALSKP